MKKNFILSCIVLSSIFLAAGSARAEALPASRCVTAATKATHAKVTSQMEKDIAPYTNENGVAAAVRTYREEVAIAWQALEEPYCGYGRYGASSAVKSYTKSTTRTRSAFLEKVKNLRKIKVASITTTSTSLAIPPTAAKKEEKKPVQKQKGVGTVRISSGWRRGMRAETIKMLQKTLAVYFDLPADDSLVTGFFGSKTEALVIKFQLEKKIILSEDDPGAGLVGPKTSAALNNL